MTMYNADNIDELVNDIYLNIFADMFLLPLGFDGKLQGYRYLRNCVILLNSRKLSVFDAIQAVSHCADKNFCTTVKEIKDCIDSAVPLDKIYNTVYSDKMSFLDKTRAYISLSNCTLTKTISTLAQLFEFFIKNHYRVLGIAEQ